MMLCPVHFAQSITQEPPKLRTDVTDWFDVPRAGEPTKDNPLKVMLWRADKWRSSSNWRYEPHVSSREYLDCSYYKYVNCEDIRFCRCWQCKDYSYDFVIREY